MSCNVPIPSIEEHVTPPDMSPSIKTHEQTDHDQCLHHFFEHPYALPDSLPDDLVAFPPKFKPPRLPATLKPPTLSQPTEPPKAVRKSQFRELLGCIPTNATPKRHDSGFQSPAAAAVREPSEALTKEIRHKEFLRSLARDMAMLLP